MLTRLLSFAAVSAVAVAGMTGCTANASGALECEAPLGPGVLSESVTLSSTGGVPAISAAASAEILSPQRSLIERAEDRSTVASEGTIVAANLAYFESVSGELLEASPGFGTDNATELFLATVDGGPILQGILCAAPGDTVAVALPAEQSIGAVTTDGASLIAVAEIVAVYGGAASGPIRALPSGFPAVVTDEQGRVGVVLPPQAAPAQPTSAVRIEGDGPVVAASSTVIGNVLTVGWDGTELKNTWETGPENLGTEEQVAQSGATFRAALTGVPVGSQVVIIEPGDGGARVSVIDVLAVI